MLQHWNEERARNWHLFRPPARPSPAEVARYAAALRDAPRTMPRGLLGSTPELRSLYVARRRFETLAAPWFHIERVEHGCDYTGAAQHPVYVLRRRSGP